MEAVIYKSVGYPESWVMSQIPGMGGTSNQLRWEKECGKNSPSFWDEFAKLFLLQMGYP